MNKFNAGGMLVMMQEMVTSKVGEAVRAELAKASTPRRDVGEDAASFSTPIPQASRESSSSVFKTAAPQRAQRAISCETPRSGPSICSTPQQDKQEVQQLQADTSAGELGWSFDARKVMSSTAVGDETGLSEEDKGFLEKLLLEWINSGKEANFAEKLRKYGKERGWTKEYVEVL